MDGQANITINGNTTLTGPNNGAHSITIYANNTEGNMAASGTVYFSIEVPKPEQEPLPTTLIGVSASVTVMGIGLVVVFRKRNHKRLFL